MTNALDTLAAAHLGVEPDGMMQFRNCCILPPADLEPMWGVVVLHARGNALLEFETMAGALDFAASIEFERSSYSEKA